MEEEPYSSRNKYNHEHILQYALWVVVFVVSVILLFQIYSSLLKLTIISFVSIFYLLWGIWHHWEEKNLNRTHVLEYLAISSLIFIILAFVFLSV